MSILISLCNDAAVGIFGSVLSASFCDAWNTRRNRRIFWGFITGSLMLQGIIYSLWDAEVLKKIYPLVVHLPLILLLYGLTKKEFWAFVSVILAYLCCQLRRWIALFTVAVASGDPILQDVVEIVITIPLLFFLLHHITPIIRPIAYRSVRFQLPFAIFPLLYYIFDYLTVVYTDYLTSGSVVVAEFMPFVYCASYLLFLWYYSAEEKEQIRLKQVQNALDIQVKQSVNEIRALRESQELARRYRHDLRHHLQYVSACIKNGREKQAQEYISGICQEIEAQKVKRYCENEMLNLILTSFVSRAEQKEIDIKICGNLPAFLLISDSDLCVLFSNALENAIHACSTITAMGKSSVIDVQFYEKEGRLFLKITNPYIDEICFEKGIPVSKREGNGIGVQSICAIVKRYGGIYSFKTMDGTFVLQLYL